MGRWKKALYAGLTLGISGSMWTLHSNNYDINSLGFIRLGRAAATAVKIGYHYKTNLYSSSLDTTSAEYDRLRSEVHLAGAKILLSLCCANKGVYIKVGQHIGALDYLVPPEYVQVMKVLHSDAPVSDFEEILKVLKQDIKRDPYEVFSHIDKEPIGAASLAQVHKAILRKDGSTVAVKIQHPLVLRNSIVDMKTMEVLVKVLSDVFEDFNFQWLVDETKINLPKELDFRLEAENADKAREKLGNFQWLKIPKVHWDLTNRRVLTMEFLDGGQVNDVSFIDRSKISRSEVTSRLGEMYAHMIFKHGFVHSDPHPGNILVRKEDGHLQIILLDHGLYANLSDDFRLSYSKFWMNILARDLDGMQKESVNLGIGDLYPLLVCMVTGRTWNSVTSGIDRVSYSAKEKESFQKEIPQFLTQIGDVLQHVNRQMLLVLKTNDLLRGIEHSLNVNKKQTSFLTMSRCCLENVYQEQLQKCQSSMQRFRVQAIRIVMIFKLNLYILCLSVYAWIPEVMIGRFRGFKTQ